jgi:hypothetical protein
MDFDLQEQSVRLEGDVWVRCGSYELASDSLRLRPGLGQVEVQGPASLLVCPCEKGPISLGFREAEIELGGDVTATAPILRVGDTPVFGLPWLRLRSPDRPGLLLPRVGWRGDGGLVLGSGVRIPWRESNGSPAWMNLYLSGYSRGGFDIESSIATPSSSTQLRVDRMDGDMVRVLSHGVTRTTRAGGYSWHADMSRGSRGRSGLVPLREAARSFDDGQLVFDLRPMPSVFARTGLVMVGVRGQEPVLLGPVAAADVGGRIGSGMSWDAGGSIFLLNEEGEGAFREARAYGKMVGGHWLGPVNLSINGQFLLHQVGTQGQDALDVAAWSGIQSALPVQREYQGFAHVVEPFLGGMVLAARDNQPEEQSLRPTMAGDGERWFAFVGGRTSAGDREGISGGKLEISGGYLGGFEESSPATLVRGRAGAHVGSWTLLAEGNTVVREGEKGNMATIRTGIGKRTTAAMGVELTTRSRVDPTDARLFSLLSGAWEARNFVSEEGTSMSVLGHIPLLSGFRLGANAYWDANHEQWLGAGSGLMWEHPCGCARGQAWVAQRRGREGMDGWLMLELR